MENDEMSNKKSSARAELSLPPPHARISPELRAKIERLAEAARRAQARRGVVLPVGTHYGRTRGSAEPVQVPNLDEVAARTVSTLKRAADVGKEVNND